MVFSLNMALMACSNSARSDQDQEIVVRVAQVVQQPGAQQKEFSFISVPFRTSELSFRVGGPVNYFEGYAGNFYKRGEVIAEIDPRDFRIRKERTEAIYKQAKTKKHAIIGMATGIVCMAVASALVNGLLLLPAYGKAFGMPVDTFVEMGAAIIPAIHSLTTFCLFSVAPFNIIKGIVVSLITLVLYKHISRLLKGSQA